MTKAEHTKNSNSDKVLIRSDNSNKIPFIQAILSHNQDKSVVKVSETQTSRPSSNINLSKENKDRPLIPGSQELDCEKESNISSRNKPSLNCNTCNQSFLSKSDLLLHTIKCVEKRVSEIKAGFGDHNYASKERKKIATIPNDHSYASKDRVEVENEQNEAQTLNETNLETDLEEKISQLPILQNRNASNSVCDSDSKSHIEWANQCSFKCQVTTSILSDPVEFCPFITKVPQKFYRHIDESHSLGGQAYQIKYGTVMTDKRVHSCLLCKETLTHTKSAIELHLKKQHQMDLKGYYLKKKCILNKSN